MDTPALLRTRDAAIRLRTTPRMLRWYSDRGMLPFERLTPRGNRLYRIADIEALEARLNG